MQSKVIKKRKKEESLHHQTTATRRFKVGIHQGLSEGRSPETLLCAIPDEHHMSCFNICLSQVRAFVM